MPPTFATTDIENAIPLHVVTKDDFPGWLSKQDPTWRAWLSSSGFTGGFGQAARIPGPGGSVTAAVAGIGSDDDRKRARFALGAAQKNLPKGTYRFAETPVGMNVTDAALGWLLAQYRFSRYAKQSSEGASLVAPDGVKSAMLETIVAGECLTRDLINTPASDMSPDALQAAAEALFASHGGKCHVIADADLLDQNFPMIHAVGRAAESRPRLIDCRWGNAGPTLTLVGKGVCFDTGGLNIKPGASMGLMKKDMGGAATVLGLAHMIMGQSLPLRLRVLIPAVENAISGNAMRPGDILTSRKGLTVEINNTDAEGRLVLADALALADAETPDLMISMATLTGAARVAVGPDLAPFYSTNSDVSDALRAAAPKLSDPVWELPFHDPYEDMIEPGIADLDNAPKGGFAGSITAALFLRRFVSDTPNYVHFDIYGWQPSSAPGRPKGGVGQGSRAVLSALPEILGL